LFLAKIEDSVLCFCKKQDLTPTEMPWLATDGCRIVDDASRQPVLLRGLNRSGLEYAEPDARGFLDAASMTESEIAHMIRGWGANIIRIPFNQDWALNGRGAYSADHYLEAIDRVIEWASRSGAYTLLDLQWLDADAARGHNPDGSPNRVPALPTLDTIALWRMLARRYQDEPAVLFDLFNEPHDPIADDETPLEGIGEDGATFPLPRRRVTMAEWQPWARRLVRTVREEHPRSLIFVSGVAWGYDLRGMPLTVNDRSQEVFTNVVYSTHVYPWCGIPPALRSPDHVRFAPRHSLNWTDAFGRLSRSAPVFIAEWGGGVEHVRWGETLARYARRLGLGWTAWSWSDRPRVVVDAQAARYDATPFGQIVHRALRDG
jgi:endoglucanase